MKQFLLAMCVFSISSLCAQPYLSLTTTTKNVGLSVGYLAEKSGIEVSAGYNVPVFRVDRPSIFNISTGKRILLSHETTDNFSVTPSIGYALFSVKDFSNFDIIKQSGVILQVNKTRIIYRLELGKDWYLGRLFISANYCGTPYFGIGIRAFIK